jgi:multidrug efflux pump subunit AcrB
MVDVQKFVLGPGGGGKIAVELKGNDPDTLRRLAQEVKDVYRADKNTKGIRDDWRPRTKLIVPVFDESEARRLGISRVDFTTAIKWNLNGNRMGVFREDKDLFPIISRPVEKERTEIESFKSHKMWSPISRKYISMDQLIKKTELHMEDSLIRRFDRKRTIKVQCDPIVGVASRVFNRLMPKLKAIELPPGYTMEFAGEYKDSREAKTKLGRNLPLGFLAMVVAIVCLFGSVRQPLVILLTVPLALIGVTAGLLTMNQSFDFMSFLGFLSLSGMLIKNAIVLIDQIAIEQNTGKSSWDAVVDATISRIRPVTMAAFTTILGMLPLITDDFYRGMSVTIMFGLGFATVLTLIVVPCLYSILYGVKPVATTK